MKKLVTLMGLMGMISSSLAHAFWEGNFLMGLAAGYEWRRGNIEVELRDPVFPFFSYGQPIHDNGWTWGLLTGYQERCNRWLWGIEAKVDWDSVDKNHTTLIRTVDGPLGEINVNLHRGATIGLSWRLGYEVAPFFLPYIRLGVENAKDRLNIDTVMTGFAEVQGVKRSFHFWSGAGLEFPITYLMGLSFRTEYAYHSKGKNIFINTTESDGTTFVFAKINPSSHTLMGSLVWNFV